MGDKKEERRKGKIQLIDASEMKSPLRKNLGDKGCELTEDIRKEILRVFLEMEESEVSHVYDNSEFGFWAVTVERPLRLRVNLSNEIPSSVFKKKEEREAVEKALTSLTSDVHLNSWTVFAKECGLKAALLKKIRPFIAEKDPMADAVEGEADPDLRDTEIIPFSYEGGIKGFMEKEVIPYAPDAWVDEKSIKIGYELSFTKHFYKPTVFRSAQEIVDDLQALEKETDGMLAEILKGVD